MQPAPGSNTHPDVQPTLRDLRRDFPQFAIWREVTGEHRRYNARRIAAGSGLYSVITADMEEMRAVLAQARARYDPVPAPLPDGAAAPNIARMYNYFLGGAGHRDADRQAARSVTAHHGEVTAIAKANRAFVLSAVTHLAARGISSISLAKCRTRALRTL